MFIWIISRTSSNVDGVGSKSRSLGQIFVKSCYHFRGYNFDPIFIKLAQNVILIISQTSSNMDGVGSKSRSLGQILVKSCYHTRGHNVDPIFIKHAQNAYIDKISKFELGWGQVKK